MKEKIIYIKSVGEVRLEQTNRVKRLSIKLKPFDGVIATFPTCFSFQDAERFVYERIDWIRKNLSKIEQVEDKYTIFDENSDFKTKFHQLVVKPWDKADGYVSLDNGKIFVFYPKHMPIRDNKTQELIRSGIEYALRVEAKHYIPKRTRQLASQFGFQINRIFIKNAKTRWGSCSGVNNINLSMHLMRLPDRLIDYVILHELCHTVEKNHGKGFWALLDKVSGNAKGLDAELNNYTIKVY